jgi:hypothetical protein
MIDIDKPFAILTATLDKFGAAVNHRRNAALKLDLENLCFEFEPVKGFYKGKDQGQCFLVHGITERFAKTLAKRHGQESIITENGLVYVADGRRVAPVGIVEGDAARATGNYTQHEDGRAWAFVF